MLKKFFKYLNCAMKAIFEEISVSYKALKVCGTIFIKKKSQNTEILVI